MRTDWETVMATKTQIVFDCTDPDRLAKFWAEALHYKLQDPPAGFATWESALKAWNVPKEEWNSASAIVDPEGRGPRIYFQQMDTPKPGKNRLHFDLNVSGGPAVSLSTRKSQVDQGGGRNLGTGGTKPESGGRAPPSKGGPRGFRVNLQGPEGNEFCVQ